MGRGRVGGGGGGGRRGGGAIGTNVFIAVPTRTIKHSDSGGQDSYTARRSRMQWKLYLYPSRLLDGVCVPVPDDDYGDNNNTLFIMRLTQ